MTTKTKTATVFLRRDELVAIVAALDHAHDQWIKGGFNVGLDTHAMATLLLTTSRLRYAIEYRDKTDSWEER